MKRRALSIVTAVVLTGAVIAGATLALLNSTAEQVNAFKFDSGTTPPGTRDLAIELKEPHWSGDAAFQFDGDTVVLPPNGDPLHYGSLRAQDFAAGRMIYKNPTVRNIGRLEAFVGVIVETKSGSTRTLGDLETYLLDIDYNTTEWQEVNVSGGNPIDPDRRYFVLKSALPGVLAEADKAPRTTTPLFQTVTMRGDINNPALGASHAIKETDAWEIVVTAFAVQAENDAWKNDPANGGADWDAENAMKVAFGPTKGTDGSEWFGDF